MSHTNLKNQHTITDLKKGDLVMTEDGLGWYQTYWNDNLSEPHRIFTIDGKKDSDVKQATKATRQDVKEYINGLGILPMEDLSYCLTHPITGDITFTIIEEQGIWAYKLDGYYFPDSGAIISVQLAEAILVARLLNATKD